MLICGIFFYSRYSSIPKTSQDIRIFFGKAVRLLQTLLRVAHARPMHTTHPEGPLGKCHELLCSHGDQLQIWLALYGFSRLTPIGIDGRLSHVQHYYSSAAAPAPAPTAPATSRGPVPSIQGPGSARDKHTVQYRHICTALRAPHRRPIRG